MSIALRLALRDLRGGLAGLGLLWLCLAVAVAGLASVTSLASSVDSAIAANGRQLLGGDLMLSVAQRDATEEERLEISRLGRFSRSVTTRAMVVANDSRSVLAELSGVDSAWPLAGKVELVRGGRLPGSNEVAIGREIAERLSLHVGESVRIGSAPFRISAIIESMPGTAGFALAPPAIMGEAGLERTGLIQPGSITATSYRLILPAGADPESTGKAFQQRFAEAGWRVSDRADAGSGTRRFIDRLGQMLLLVALSALAIGGLGMSSAAAAFAASRRSSIAIFKLLGSGRQTIYTILFAEIGLVAGLAILAGLAVGAAAPALIAGAVAPLLPVAPDPTPQWLALGEAALFGALISFAASWRMVSTAADTRPAGLLRGDVANGETPHWRSSILPAIALALAAGLAIAGATDRSLAAMGIAAIAALCGLFALLGLGIRIAARRARHIGGPVARLGISALARPGAATGRLAVSLGLGLTMLVMLAATASSILAEIDTSIPRRAPALFLIDIPRDQERTFRALASREAPGAELRLVPSLRGPVTAINGTPVARMKAIPEGAWILRGDRGLTFAEALPPANRIVAGSWWPPGYRGEPLVSIDVEAARALNLKIGDRLTVTILGRPVEARIASFREIDWRSFGFNFAIIFSPGALDAAPYTLMATLAPSDGGSTIRFERRLTSDLPMVSAIRVADVVAQVKSMLESVDGAIRVATGFAILMGMIVLAGSVVATRRQRMRDIILLRLVGASRAQVSATQLIEFALLALAVSATAFAAGAVLAKFAVEQWFEFPYRPDWVSLGVIPLGAIALSMAAAFIAAIPALNARPAEGLRSL